MCRMSANERSAIDAVMVLESVARILRASPHRGETLTAGWAEQHAKYLEDIAAATARDAGITSDEVAAARAYVDREWDTAFLPVLFPGNQIENIYAAMHGH